MASPLKRTIAPAPSQGSAPIAPLQSCRIAVSPEIEVDVLYQWRDYEESAPDAPWGAEVRGWDVVSDPSAAPADLDDAAAFAQHWLEEHEALVRLTCTTAGWQAGGVVSPWFEANTQPNTPSHEEPASPRRFMSPSVRPATGRSIEQSR